MSYDAIAKSTPRARKPHRCDWCGDDILKGERHSLRVGVFEGEFQASRYHLECEGPCMEYCRENDCYTPHNYLRGQLEPK